MASGAFPGGYPLGFMPRRSVVDPDTGQPLVTSAPTGEVRQRASLLPIGRDDSGALVPAVPQGLFDAIDAARFPGRVARGEAEVFDRATGHVSDEAMGAATGLAGLAMTGGLGGVAREAGETVLGGGPFIGRRLTFDSPLSGPKKLTEASARNLLEQRQTQIAEQSANPALGVSPPSFHREVEGLQALLPKFEQDLPRGRPFQPLRDVEGDGPYAVRVQDRAPDEREYRVYDRTPSGGLSRPRGTASVSLEPDGRWRTDMLETREGHTGRGLASALYDGLERDTGQKRAPSGQLLPDGYAFWQRRNPDAVQFHQPFDQSFWSPKALLSMAEDRVYANNPAKNAELQAAIARVPPEGRTPEALARQHYLVPGAVAAGAGAAALALPDEARAAPSNPQDRLMSAGAIPGFGLIPNAGPDDIRRLLQLMPLDPSQRPPIMDAGGPATSDIPPGLQGQMPRAPSRSGGLLDMADLNGPAGAQIHHPGTVKPPGMQPAIAMNEADTQRLEQQTGMMPPAPASGGLLSELLGKAPMGAPQSFAGTSGTIVPSQGPDLSGSPLPPARPSAADLAAPAPSARPLGFGSLTPPRASRPQQADMPAPGAVPVAGQAPSAQPPAATSAPAGAAEPSFLDRMMKGIQGTNGLLGSIGSAMLTTPGMGQALGVGLRNQQALEEKRSVTDLARAEFGLKQRKITQETLGNNVTYQRLVEKGVDPADASAAIAASAAGHNEALSNLLNNTFRKTPDAPTGYAMNPDGTMRTVVGGPADPATKRAESQASAEGNAAGKPAEGFSLPEGNTRYNADGTPLVTAPSKTPDGFDRETKLRGEFTKGLGSFHDVHDAYGRVIASTEQRAANPKSESAASDISLVFGYMKMLDPGSVVREGEYATAANAAGIPERIRNAYNKAKSGEFLSPEQRQDFIEQADRLYGKARAGAETVAGRYRNLAGQYGVDPERAAFLPPAYTAPKVGPSRLNPDQPAAAHAPSRTPARRAFDPATGGFR